MCGFGCVYCLKKQHSLGLDKVDKKSSVVVFVVFGLVRAVNSDKTFGSTK